MNSSGRNPFQGRINHISVVPAAGCEINKVDPNQDTPSTAMLINRVQIPAVKKFVMSKPAIITVDFGQGAVECRVDSGADISVLTSYMLPIEIMEETSNTNLVLQGTFGERVTAKLVNVPARLSRCFRCLCLRKVMCSGTPTILPWSGVDATSAITLLFTFVYIN